MPENEALFGHVAVELGIITNDQLVDATRLQNDPDENRALGDLLVDLGWISRQQVQQIIQEQRARRAAAGAEPDLPQPDEVAEPAVPDALPASSYDSLESILREAVDKGASDIHVHSGSKLRFRVHGGLVTRTSDTLPPEFVAGLVERILDETQRAELEREAARHRAAGSELGRR